MENAQIVGILHIALSKPKRNRMLISQKMEGIKGLGLSFSDGWHVRGSWQTPIARERPSCVLDDQSLRSRLGLWLIVKQWSQCILVPPTTKTITKVRRFFKFYVLRSSTYFSLAQGSARVLIRSGLVLASSLYTVHELDNLLSPPSAAVSKHAKAITSPESV